MKHSGSIFLIGPMGAGKTTIGRLLAKSLKIPFYDSDQEIESRTGVDIATIFEYEGESGFRKRESVVIDELTEQHPIVLATGGGAILNEANRSRLSSGGFVAYLACSIERQLERTYQDSKRPLLDTPDPRQTLETLQAEREPFYLDSADFTLDTGSCSSRNASSSILKAFNDF